MFKHIKLIHIFYLALLLAVLSACTNNNGLDKISLNTVKVEVYDYNEDRLIMTIEDQITIDELTKALNESSTASIANLDFELPDYKLLFKNQADQNIFTIGYYKDVVNLGLAGQYLDVENDLMYGVVFKLALP